MLKILVDDTLGKIYDISEIVTEATWKTSRIGKPGSFDFTMLQDESYIPENGNLIQAYYDDVPLFKGYIFTIGRQMEETLKIKAYDQMRYLASSDTYVFANRTAASIMKQIADDFGLKWGHVVDTKYKIPKLVKDNTKLIDIITEAMALTIINTGTIYNFYDDFGNLSIKRAAEMSLDLIIGDESLMTGFDFEKSIDSDTYNHIKLVRDNKKTKRRDKYEVKDSANIAKWGRLQYFQVVNEKMNEAQIKQLIETLSKHKNRETKTLKIDALGDPSVRAGCYVHMLIGELAINQPYLIEDCTHKFSGDDYTLSLELAVI